jgi:hypothetical protein
MRDASRWLPAWIIPRCEPVILSGESAGLLNELKNHLSHPQSIITRGENHMIRNQRYVVLESKEVGNRPVGLIEIQVPTPVYGDFFWINQILT